VADRQQWEHATAPTRHLAIAADTELLRRHPDQPIEPLRSAEPVSLSDAKRQQRQLTEDQKTAETAARIRDLAAQHQAFREKLDQRQRLNAPGYDLSWGEVDKVFPSWQAPGQDAILQPPKPEITPSARILRLAAERDTEPEAAD
jgi:hypothetical protein